jgi:hypothetical protein
MLIFIAGIMQGSLLGEKELRDQSYRVELQQKLQSHFEGATVYDPYLAHRNSLAYDEKTGRETFFTHCRMCREEADVVVAFVPEASMGTAIEIWEAKQGDAVVVTISPMKHNWAVKFLSDLLYPDLDAFLVDMETGRLERQIQLQRSRK